MMQEFMTTSKSQTKSILTSIQQQLDRLANANNVSPSLLRKQHKETKQAGGSLNPTASQTLCPQNGTRALTGDFE